MKNTPDISPEVIEKVLTILEEEVVPAEGCTEPIAIAYVGAKAREILGCIPDKVDIYASGNIIKNVKSVVVPNSGGMVGIEVAAAMGIIAGDSSKDLMVISEITEAEMAQVRDFLEKVPVTVHHEKTNIKLYVRIEIEAKGDKIIVEIKHLHTNITQIIKDGKNLITRPCSEADFNTTFQDREILSIELIYNLAKTIDITRIDSLLRKVIKYNSTIAEEGLIGNYGVNIGKCILENIETGLYGDDVRNRAASYAAAGSDARMSGCPLPVMTTSGSGNQGMTASLPLIKFAKLRNKSEEDIIRALFFSHLATVHIKTKIGRLSAYCGAMCASAAASGALVFLYGDDVETVASAITNTLGNISGVICDGAKASCAMKIATGIYAAFDSATLAHYHRVLHNGEGIIGKNIEETIKNIGELAQDGMHETDDVILDIMTKEK